MYIICSIKALFEILSLYIEWFLCIDIPHFQIHLTQPEVRQSSSSDSSSSSSSPALNRGAPWMMDVDFSKRTIQNTQPFHCDGLPISWTGANLPKIRSDSRCLRQKTPADEGVQMGLSLSDCFFFSRLIIDDHHFRMPIHHKNGQKMERLQVTALMKASVPDGVSHGLGDVGCWAKETKETKEITRKPRQRPPKVRGPEFWISGSFLPLVIEMGNAWPDQPRPSSLGKFDAGWHCWRGKEMGRTRTRSGGTLFSPILTVLANDHHFHVFFVIVLLK